MTGDPRSVSSTVLGHLRSASPSLGLPEQNLFFWPHNDLYCCDSYFTSSLGLVRFFIVFGNVALKTEFATRLGAESPELFDN